jgi:hypothetical protein
MGHPKCVDCKEELQREAIIAVVDGGATAGPYGPVCYQKLCRRRYDEGKETRRQGSPMAWAPKYSIRRYR